MGGGGFALRSFIASNNAIQRYFAVSGGRRIPDRGFPNRIRRRPRSTRSGAVHLAVSGPTNCTPLVSGLSPQWPRGRPLPHRNNCSVRGPANNALGLPGSPLDEMDAGVAIKRASKSRWLLVQHDPLPPPIRPPDQASAVGAQRPSAVIGCLRMPASWSRQCPRGRFTENSLGSIVMCEDN